MKLKVFILLIALLSAISLVILLNKNDLKFVTDELPKNKNHIINKTNNSYYDTIAYYSLDLLGISNQKILITNLSEANINENISTGEIKGGLGVLDKGKYVMFLSDLSKYEALDVIPHEIIHLKQYYDGDCINIDDKTVLFKNIKYNVFEIDYSLRPWEIEAYEKGGLLSSKLRTTIIK